jgi:adenine phosphoribosyltransferase
MIIIKRGRIAYLSFFIQGLDARGFLFGPLVALRLGAAFVPVRKSGKLPGECAQATYMKEYGEVNFV